MNELFNLEHQFNLYLKMVKLNRQNLSELQLQETRRAFYGGMAQMMMLLTDDMRELSESDYMKTLDNLHQQIGRFWENETN